MLLDSIEQWIGSLGAIAGLATLAYAIIGMFKSLRQPSGREERGARFAPRVPVLLVATILFVWVGALLWRPLPMLAQSWLRVILLSVGALLFFCGLALYLWGMRSLTRARSFVEERRHFGIPHELTPKKIQERDGMIKRLSGPLPVLASRGEGKNNVLGNGASRASSTLTGLSTRG